MEDALHRSLYSLVMRIDRFWVVRTAGWVEGLGRSQQGLDGFVSENDERSHRPETGRKRLVAAGLADPTDDLFAAEFLQNIRGWRTDSLFPSLPRTSPTRWQSGMAVPGPGACCVAAKVHGLGHDKGGTDVIA